MLAFWMAAVVLITGTNLAGALIIQLRVVEGEGAVYAPGSRATRGLTVMISDETGNAVSGAAVSFRLPDQGPGGTFTGGLRTQMVTTQADGRASVWGMQWNKTPGPFEIRITAVKDQARAGLISTQSISLTAPPQSGGTGSFKASHHGRTMYLIAGAVAAGAAAGLLFGRSQAKTAAAPTTIPTTIGAPSIVIGHP